MTTVRIPFAESQTSGHSTEAGAIPLSENILVDGAAAMYCFPGTSTWSLFPEEIPNASPIIGMRKFGDSLVYVCEDRTVWALTAPGVVEELSTTDTLPGGTRPVFADGGDRLFIAGGGKPAYWEGIGTILQIVTDADAPNATHIIAANDRMYAASQGVAQEILYTNPGVGEQVAGWEAINFIAAVARFDPIVALHENGRQIFAWGSESLQSFDPDPNIILAPFPADDIGLGAAFSVVKLPERKAFAWLDNRRRIVVGTGRGETEVLSDQIAKDLTEIEDWEDCVGWRMVWRDHDLLIWAFPSRTFCFDVTRKRWFELSARVGGNRAAWPVTELYQWDDQGVILCGLSTGEIQIIDPEATTMGGLAYIGEVESGYRNHGNDADKETIELRLRCRRGQSDSPDDIVVAYRDRPGPWTNVRFSLGAMDDTAHTVKKDLVEKPYTARDWKLTMPPTAVVVSVEEKFDALEE